jgi:serine-type D-Ala-D-Ala carboxypeptidase/endopeptidase (penicillin-binding protein 4)
LKFYKGDGKMERVWKKLEDALQAEPKLKGSLAGISIRSSLTGELLYEHQGDIRLHPASNMKIFTCAVGLTKLGEDYTFKTELHTDGKVTDGMLIGNVYLKGKGDPTLLQTNIDLFSKRLVEKGIYQIEGNIIGDDSWYDDIRLSQDLNWNDEHQYYGSQVSALTVSPNEDYDSGTVKLTVTPSSIVGEQPTITLTPKTEYIQLINKATTIAALIGEEHELMVTRGHGNNVVTISGTIPIQTEPVTEWVAVWEPTNYVLELFGNSLMQAGINWSGKVLTGKTPESATLIHEHISMPLKDLAIPFMKLSNNGHGETIVKELGKVVKGEGSWDCGLEVMNSTLQKFGVDTSNIVIRDGSGISHVTLIPPNEISKFLFRIQREKWFPSFYRSLPIAGREERMVGGTLRERMTGLHVNAKTGTIMGVSTLSGYLKVNNEESFIFSIMLNNLLDEEDGPDIIDRLLEIIVQEKSKTIHT